jgi:hypothetical protein
VTIKTKEIVTACTHDKLVTFSKHINITVFICLQYSAIRKPVAHQLNQATPHDELRPLAPDPVSYFSIP